MRVLGCVGVLVQVDEGARAQEILANTCSQTAARRGASSAATIT